MSKSVIVSVVALAVGGQVAFGQTPTVENLFVARIPLTQVSIPETPNYVDIPNSERAVNVPSGTALITWSLNAGIGGGIGPMGLRIRPAIGAASPAEGLFYFSGGNVGEHFSGSWVTNTEAGPISVRLQVASDTEDFDGTADYFQDPRISSLSWSLIVFPDDPPPPVPAISGIGLGIMLLFIASIGGFVFKRVRLQEV